jgi:hypothetical protein
MTLTMMLKMEVLSKKEASEEFESLLEEVVRALRPLLRLPGRLDRGQMAEENDVEGRVHDVTSAAAEVGNRLRGRSHEDEAVEKRNTPGVGSS